MGGSLLAMVSTVTPQLGCPGFKIHQPAGTIALWILHVLPHFCLTVQRNVKSRSRNKIVLKSILWNRNFCFAFHLKTKNAWKVVAQYFKIWRTTYCYNSINWLKGNYSKHIFSLVFFFLKIQSSPRKFNSSRSRFEIDTHPPHPSIFFHYLKLGRHGSRLCRIFQLFFSPATS